ncbi:MAG: hypothetical protein ACI9SP_004371 [Arenicella sp.]|jgi:hypothetical protein
MENILPQKDVLELGRYLAKELGFSQARDVLGEWMAHHVSGLVRDAEAEGNTELGEKIRNDAVKVILEIWQHRTSLPGAAYPLSRYKDVINTLSVFSEESSYWERNNLGNAQSLAANSVKLFAQLCRGLHLAEFSLNMPERPPSAAIHTLSEEEAMLYEQLSSWVTDESESKTADIDLSGKYEASQSMSDLIDQLCEQLTLLKESL